MNKRSSMILSKIMSENQVFKVTSLMDIYKVSLRTIYNDLESINDLLLSKDIERIKILQNGDILFSGDRNKAINVLNEVDLYRYHLSKKERITIIALELLLNDDYITVATICDTLEVSRATVLNDLPDAKELIGKMRLEVLSRSNKGIMAIGEEKEKRTAILELLTEVLNRYGPENPYCPYLSIVLSVMDISEYLDDIKKNLKIVEKQLNLYLSDQSFYRTANYLAIAAKRMGLGHYIAATEFKKGKKYNFAYEVIIRINNDFNLELYDGEIQLLESILDDSTFIKERITNLQEIIRIQNIARQFIGKISSDLKIDLSNNYVFYDNLMTHIKSMGKKVSAAHDDEAIDNLLNKRYKNVRDAAEKNIFEIELYLNRQLTENEKTDLIIHICGAIDNKLHKERKITSVVVCGSGIGISSYLAETLKIKFNIDIKAVISSHLAEEYLGDDIDLIITTVPLKNIDKRMILVNRLLRDVDYLKIQKEIDLIHEIKNEVLIEPINISNLINNISDIIHKSVGSNIVKNLLTQDISHEIRRFFKNNIDYAYNLHEMITPSQIRLDVKCENYVEAIKLSAEPLLTNGYIEKPYVDSMLKTLKNHAEGLVVGKGFAIPYTGFDKSVIHTGMSLIRLRDSVSFGHPSYDPVDLVCCLGANNTKSHLKAFFNLIHLAQKDEFKRQLRLAETTEEMNDIIKTYEIELNNTREVMV